MQCTCLWHCKQGHSLRVLTYVLNDYQLRTLRSQGHIPASTHTSNYQYYMYIIKCIDTKHIKLLLYPFLSSTVSNSVKILTVVHFCDTVARKYMHSNCSLVHIQMLKLPTTKHSVHSEAAYIFAE